MPKKKKKTDEVTHCKVDPTRKGAKTKVLCGFARWTSCTDHPMFINCPDCMELMKVNSVPAPTEEVVPTEDAQMESLAKALQPILKKAAKKVKAKKIAVDTETSDFEPTGVSMKKNYFITDGVPDQKGSTLADIALHIYNQHNNK